MGSYPILLHPFSSNGYMFILFIFSTYTEEKFAQAVCFLLIDLYLLTCQAEKALHLLAVLEKMISQGGNNKNGKNEVGLEEYSKTLIVKSPCNI